MLKSDVSKKLMYLFIFYLNPYKYIISPIFIPLSNFSAVLMAKKVQPNVKVGGLGTNCKKSKTCLPFTKTGSTIITEIFSRYYKLQKGFRNCDFNLSNIFKIKKVFQFIVYILGLLFISDKMLPLEGGFSKLISL